jgi:membrane dipeptidase
MDRRQFIQYSIAWGLSLAAVNRPLYAYAKKVPIKDGTILKDIRIIDAHAHPDRFHSPQSSHIDRSSTIKKMKELGMEASVFAAVGDLVFLSKGRLHGSEFHNTMSQLRRVKGLAERNKLKLVFKAADVPTSLSLGNPPGAILAIEGGDALGGDPNKVDEFYRAGVRMITLVHYRINELGDIMTAKPKHNGLTSAGRKIMKRMQDLGMIVDVAHAHELTLKQIVQMSNAPLIDSHSSHGSVHRLRPWADMELVAKTSGVICTWPLRIRGRKTFTDWANEILEMKKRLGMEHVGLGTDGGGRLPKWIKGYRDIRDLVHLANAMREVGLSHDDIAAYMGGNFYRILQRCIG